MTSSVRVLEGKDLRRDQRKVLEIQALEEYEKRVEGLTGKNSYHTWPNIRDYLHTYREVSLKDRDCRGSEMNDRCRRHPAAALAVIEVVEALQDEQAEKMFRARWWPFYHFPFWKRFKLVYKFIALEAHTKALELQKIVDPITTAFGSDVMDEIDLQIDVIEAPVYVSPRAALPSELNKDPDEEISNVPAIRHKSGHVADTVSYDEDLRIWVL